MIARYEIHLERTAAEIPCAWRSALHRIPAVGVRAITGLEWVERNKFSSTLLLIVVLAILFAIFPEIGRAHV